MSPETCEDHITLVSDIAVIKNDLAYIKDRVCNHIEEGDKQGGYRDRVVILEQQLSALRTSVWKISATAGFIGALLGNIIPEAIQLLSKWVVGK